VTDPSEYAREIETYLCRKNRGHLIRVVGPAFELVCGWAADGVPLKVAFRGIDRCCARLTAKGPRRRPVRIEFCEADVLEAFDDWRRAVGVMTIVGDAGHDDEGRSRRPPLAGHIERVIARLAHARGTGAASTPLHRHIDETVRELEEMASTAGRLRGEARTTMVARLEELDRSLMDAAVRDLDEPRAKQLQAEAVEELVAFGTRMPPEARYQAIAAAFLRLVRESAGLPVLTYE
jgi:hypothetical protein